jgi:hypothetical protein
MPTMPRATTFAIILIELEVVVGLEVLRRVIIKERTVVGGLLTSVVDDGCGRKERKQEEGESRGYYTYMQRLGSV